MWKIVVGFVVFAVLALFVLSKGGDIDLSGEKHGASQTSVPAVSSGGYRGRRSGLKSGFPGPSHCCDEARKECIADKMGLN
ncbi:hypothetical protein LP416_08725 [Polaromonas sp. P2-4]|nr:hypothetical protein LP416_08725 [Polaromonas sp. P2-4]